MTIFLERIQTGGKGVSGLKAFSTRVIVLLFFELHGKIQASSVHKHLFTIYYMLSPKNK